MTSTIPTDVRGALKVYREALLEDTPETELEDLTHMLLMAQENPDELLKGMARVAADVRASKAG